MEKITKRAYSVSDPQMLCSDVNYWTKKQKISRQRQAYNSSRCREKCIYMKTIIYKIGYFRLIIGDDDLLCPLTVSQNHKSDQSLQRLKNRRCNEEGYYGE